MKKCWATPKLSNLNLQATKSDTPVLYGIQAGAEYKFMCNTCNQDTRNDINEIDTTEIGGIYTTPNQQCGVCGGNTWIKVPSSYIPPVINPSN